MAPIFDEARRSFINAFKEYTPEGNLMRDLLLSHDSLRPPADFSEVIMTQQARLDAARERYNRAREAYVNLILPDLILPTALQRPDSPYHG